MKKRGKRVKAKSDLLFELSWEVCNKVGGIYTVVMSKAALMKQHFKHYYLIGPYFEGKTKFEFTQETPPPEIAEAFKEVADEQIFCHFGKWKVKGEPYAILIDCSKLKEKKDELKAKLWEDYKIDSMNAQWDVEEPLIWSYAASRVIQKIVEKYPSLKSTMHCHEWLAGYALLFLKKNKVKIGTVFTTHATMLGRALAGNNFPLYEKLAQVNPQEEAYRLKIETKYLTEKSCAQTTDVFTTVSEITAIEAEKLLGRKADVLVLNGLDIGKFPTIEETSIKHLTVRERIREFLTYYFFPYYPIELEHNLIFFILGRYEFRNKGLDIFIKALGKLNDRLKKEKTKRTISVFFWIPAGHGGLNTQVLENKNYFRHIKNFVDYNSDNIINKTVSAIVSRKKLSLNMIFSEEFFEHLRKDVLHFKRQGNPPLSTHYMDDKDTMITELKNNGLQNREEDKVKAIIYPVYLDGADEMINLSYYDTIAGAHLGVFPSYYEPWGYTPLEAAALAIPSVTTDLAGFGRFISKHAKKKEGIFILKRMKKKDDQVVQDFADILYKYSMLNRKERVQNKTVAKSLASCADWSILIKNYIEAHNLAVQKVFGK
ncbi:hypothetical protein GOV09_03510 [Candidatus Woesearchaeota archaeon]|nr:hypothetical protein [Candidatus Woesearchaeota archaeon]